MSTFNLRHWVGAAAVTLLLAACGGGGDSDSTPAATPNTSTPANPGNAALLFTPGTVTATMEAGTSQPVSVNATVRRPSDFTGMVYAMVVDTAGVILPDARVIANSQTEYSVVLHTAPSLAVGNYKGNLTINLCRDQSCSAHWPGSGMQLPYDFTVRPPAPAAAEPLQVAELDPLRATLNSGAAGLQRTFSIYGKGLEWSATTTATWLTLDRSSGTGSAAIVATINPAGVAPGTYQASIQIVAKDGQTAQLPAALTVLPNGFVATRSGFAFNAVNGAPIDTEQIEFELDTKAAAAWTLASDAAWLGVTPTTGITPGRASLSVNPARGVLASGSHTAKLTLSAPSATTQTFPVQLTLTTPTLTPSVTAVTLGGAYGRDPAPAGFKLSLNTGSNAWPWTLTGLPAWAKASAVQGNVNETGTAISLSGVFSSTTVGSTTVMLNAQAQVNGDTVKAPVALTINRDEEKILPSEAGVAMVSTPGWKRLSRTMTVSNNFGKDTGWTAKSSQGWLSVTRSGSTLTLLADPTLAPSEAVSYATVTLTSTDAGVAAPEVVKVALWKSDTDPAATSKLSSNYRALVADPIRPFFYVHGGGAALDIFNVYTAQKVGSVSLGAALGSMAISPNGDRLYAYDTANRAVVQLDLATMTKGATWALPTAADAQSRILSIRPNGVEIVLTSAGAYRAADGKQLSKGTFGTPDMAATVDGKHVFTQDEGYSPASAGVLSVDYSAIAGGTLFTAHADGAWFYNGSSNGRDIATNADGSRVYTATGAPYQCSILDAKLSPIGFLPGGSNYPNNVEVDSNGRVYCGIDGIYSDADVWVHSASGALLTKFKFAGYAKGLLDRQMAVSADGMMLIALTNDPQLSIIAVGP